MMLPGREDGDVKREFVGVRKENVEGGAPLLHPQHPEIPQPSQRQPTGIAIYGFFVCWLAVRACIYVCACEYMRSDAFMRVWWGAVGRGGALDVSDRAFMHDRVWLDNECTLSRVTILRMYVCVCLCVSVCVCN